MKVIYCGGRTYADYKRVSEVIATMNPSHIVHGAAKGADSLAGRYAREHSIKCTAYPAQWRKKDPRTGRTFTDIRAGIDRNKQMLHAAKPDYVVAFPGGTGTRHMADYARANGYRVITIPAAGPLPELPKREAPAEQG